MIKEYYDKYFNKYKYHFIGGILVLVCSYLFKKYIIKDKLFDGSPDKNYIVPEIKKEEEPPIKNNQEDLIMISKIFKKEMGNSMKTLISFAKSEIERFENKKYTEFSKELFRKDIIKRNLLIDTITLPDPDKDTSNYKINIGSENYPDKFKNVIGFRLINALIPNTYLRVNSNNNEIHIEYNDGTSSGSTFIEMDEGAYTFESLGDYLMIKLRNYIPNIVITSDINTYKYSVSGLSGNESIKFLWEKSANSAYKLFGALKKDGPLIDPSSFTDGKYTFENSADQSIHFVDIVIDEIPNIACKMNSKGKNIIDRIPLSYPTGSLSFYRSPEGDLQTKNYFYPMDLSTLNIKLYDDFGKLYENSNADHYLEFEVTILENDSLV